MRKLALILTFCFVAGCNLTPQQRADKAHAVYTNMLVAADQSVQQHKLTKDQEREVKSLVPVARSSLDAIDALVSTGGSAFDTAIATLYNVVAKINAANVAKPATQPSH